MSHFRYIASIMLAYGLLAGSAHAASPLAEVVKSNAESSGVDLKKVDALYEETILEDDNIDLTVRRIGLFADNPDKTALERANHHLTIAHIHWRHGSQEQALGAVDSALALRETPDSLLLKARLLDATGNPGEATEWYRKAAEHTDSATEKEFIRIRLTMAEASNRNIDALVDLADQGDAAFRNRAAITLALLGHPDQALALYDPGEASGNLFRQHVRVAQWAIDAGDFKRAQQASWTAYGATQVRTDALYALALLAESYRKADALDELLAHLAAQTADNGEPDPMLVQARVDILIETENYDEAIAFYEAADGTRVDVEARSRLIKLYEAAGRTDDMVAEYERLMAREPDVVAWFAGLASHHLNMARPEDALAVWHRLAASNRDRIEILVEAGEAMVQMGFVEEAVDMIEAQIASSGEIPQALLFLFDLRLRRGETEQAVAAIERLEAALGDGTTGIRDLADAYERLNRPDASIRILERLRDREGELGYDERMRLAWLYSVADRKEDAMQAWRELWVSVESAARRSLAESQFLLLATELNTLGDIVVELEEKLILKQADRNEVGLLVRIYTEVGDQLSATEVIEEYARYSDASEAERLRQLGKVHMMLADYSAYDEVLRELVTADSENEIEHIQNIVLNMLAFDLAEDSDERFSEIQRWLARLRELDEEGVSGEFEAGIYSMGGFNRDAIASYRRALVLHPENSDNLLLMADLMKSSNRRDEAVAILQYAAEHAGDDAEFVVAIDGIINMIGARTFTEELTPAMRRTFRWSQRIILERIAGHNDKFYLYQLLGDIAQEVGDRDAEFRAVENSLSEAGVRRPSVLRELVTLATAEAGFAGFSTGAGDPERQLTHGRRLIGLRQELPPEVFINLGKVLLEEEAVQAAVQAFDLINDITGLINVDQTKADLFLDAGYPDESLNWYTRALNVSRDNLALLARTAMLRETQGQEEVANALYFRAIDNVLRGLATKRVEERPGANASPFAMLGLGPDTSVTRDYRTYFEYLAQGLFTTWPDDPGVAQTRFDAIKAMFDTELSVALAEVPEDAAVDSPEDSASQGLDLDEFTRLDRITQFARRVAERAADTSLDEYLDDSLAERFAAEPEDVARANEPLLRRHMENAKRNDDFETAVRLARLAGDDEDLLELFRDRISEGNYREGLAYARSLLDASNFKRLVAAIAATLKDNPKSFLELIRADADLVLEIESDLGREVVTVEELFAILADPATQEDTGFFFFSSGDGVWKYLKAKGSVDDQLRHLAATAARQRRGQFGSPTFVPMAHDLLKLELSASQREALADAVTDYLAKLDLRSEYSQSAIFQVLLVPDAHPANRGVLYELAGQAQRMAQMTIDVAATMRGLLEGSDEEAFSKMLELERAGVRYWGALSGTDEKYAPVRARILDSVLRGDTEHDAETVRIVYRFEFSNRYFGAQSPRETTERLVELLPNLIERYPDDDRYLRELVMAHIELSQWDAAEKALYACYEGDPEDEVLRAALYYLLTYRERYDAALALVTDGGPDLRETSVIDDLLEKVRAARGSDSSSGAQLFRAIYRGTLEPTWSYLSPQVDRSVDTLRELAASDADPRDDEARKALRIIWRGALAPAEDRAFGPQAGYMINNLLSLPLVSASEDPYRYFPGRTNRDFRLDALLEEDDETDPKTLFESIATRPYSAREFDLYLRSLPDEQRRHQHRFYRLLGDAYAGNGRAEALAPRIVELGDHDFTVWMLLRHQQSEDLDESEHDAFQERANRIEDPTALQVLAMARLHAKAGAFDEASEHYRLLTAKLARHGEFTGPGGGRIFMIGGGASGALMDLSELAREVTETLPPDAARDTVESILVAARRADRHDAYAAYFDVFLLRVLAHLYTPQEVLAEAGRFSQTATTVEMPLGDGEGAKAVELVRLSAMAGDTVRAFELLRTLFRSKGHGVGSVYALPESQRQERFELISALQTLARLYGLRQLDLYSGSAPFHDLILRRERPFPAETAHHWPGDVAWMTAAAAAMVSWLDDPDIDRASLLEAAFVVAWQLHSRGEDEQARAIVSKLAERITADPNRLGLQHLVLMALRVGNALPPELAAAALAQGNLSVEQEVEIIEGLEHAGDPATALRVGRAADRDDKLAVMQVLAPLADAVGDETYAEELKNRISASEEARRGLRLDESA